MFCPENWKHTSSAEHGFHPVITPENSECRELQMFRLNLAKGDSFTLQSVLEQTGVIIMGSVVADGSETLKQYDGFYIPGGEPMTLVAQEESIIYIGAAVSDAPGKRYFSHFNADLPLGDIHQIHGKPPYDREVYFTLPPQIPASRLIAGVTWSRDGAWTSWPPHQHEADLEEGYFYFGPQAPRFGMHLSFLKSGQPGTVHTVHAGDCVEAPVGYHPTVVCPGAENAYFWVLAARKPSSRSYNLAKEDPAYAKL